MVIIQPEHVCMYMCICMISLQCVSVCVAYLEVCVGVGVAVSKVAGVAADREPAGPR